MAGRLIVFGLLWLVGISLITHAAFRYFNDGQHLAHEKEMSELGDE
jgi:hypothetical protein